MSSNYADVLGIQNEWAPIVFAVVYFLLMVWYIVQAVRKHSLVYGPLAFFSAIRVVAYSLRATMASNHHNAAFNKKMAIAYSVFYNVGLFSVLYSAYRLMHDRRRLAKINRVADAIHGNQRAGGADKVASGTHRTRLVELLLLAAVATGIAGLVLAFSASKSRTGNSLNDASTYIFLAVAVAVMVLAILAILVERKFRGGSSATGAPHHHAILFLIGLLLLLRSLYYAATVHERSQGRPGVFTQAKQTAQTNEHLWYPLAALAELLAVLLFLTPALVPLRSFITRHRRERREAGYTTNEKRGHNTTGTGYAAGDVGAAGGLHAADAV